MLKQSIPILLVSLLLISCRKQPDVLFEIPFRLNFEIPAGLNPFEKHFFSVRNVPSNINSLRSQFQVPENQVLVIRPATAIFTSVLQNISLEFVEEIGISMFQGSDIENDTDVFLTDAVPPNAGRNINILGFDYDVADQFSQPNVNFLISLRLRAPTPVFIDGNIELKFVAEQ